MAEKRQRTLPLLAAGALALGLQLDAVHVELFERYLGELQAWHDRANLTALRDEAGIQTLHFLDSLTLVPLLDELFPEGGRLIDVGSGAGFPGLPVRIVRPTWSVTLLEATAKKASFLSHVLSLLDLEDVTVLAMRAEALAHDDEHRERYDIVAARAVLPLPALLELTLPFVRLGGFALLPKSRRQSAAEVARSANALTVLGGGTPALRSAGAEPGLGERDILVIRKRAATPSTYPRRPGIPAKRPL